LDTLGIFLYYVGDITRNVNNLLVSILPKEDKARSIPLLLSHTF